MPDAEMFALIMLSIFALTLYVLGIVFAWSVVAEDIVPNSRLLRALSLILCLMSWLGWLLLWVIYGGCDFLKFLYTWIKDG